jgi:hypothetical protein
MLSALVIVGTPLVARALGDEPVPATESPTESPNESSNESPEARSARNPTARSLISPQISPIPRIPWVLVLDADTPPEPAPETPLEIATRVMTDAYAWDERGPRIEALQAVLGVVADGWYSHSTLAAHRSALEFAGLPTDGLPVAPVPAGPSSEQWAALRRCESGGDYSITNPSGRYRGAYQFDRSTWNSIAERHAPGLVGVDPAGASPADQDAMAQALYGERGARPWPHCGRHLR